MYWILTILIFLYLLRVGVIKTFPFNHQKDKIKQFCINKTEKMTILVETEIENVFSVKSSFGFSAFCSG
jgi:hypothetical protein